MRNKASFISGKFYTLVSSLLLCIISFSCNENGISEYHLVSMGVRGRVIGGTRNTGAPNLTVKIQDQSCVTDNTGSFLFNGIKPPFDVFVSDTLNKTASIFRGFNSPSLMIPHDVPNLNSAFPEAAFKVKANIPYPINNMRVYFTDGLNTNGMGAASDADSVSFTVALNENKPVRGKLYVLLYTTDIDGKVTSYNRFGYIDSVYANPGSSLSYIIPDSIFKTTPVVKSITGSILTLPYGYSWSASFCISMSPRIYDYSPASTVIMRNIQTNFSIIVPYFAYGPGYSFVSLQLFDSTGSQVKSGYINTCVETWGGNTLSVISPQEAGLSSPPAGSVVDANTVFNRVVQNQGKMSHFIFSDSVRTFHVYTVGTTCTMKDFENMGIGTFAAGSKIYVTVDESGAGYYTDLLFTPNLDNICGYRTPPGTRVFYMRTINN